MTFPFLVSQSWRRFTRLFTDSILLFGIQANSVMSVKVLELIFLLVIFSVYSSQIKCEKSIQSIIQSDGELLVKVSFDNFTLEQTSVDGYNLLQVCLTITVIQLLSKINHEGIERVNCGHFMVFRWPVIEL